LLPARDGCGGGRGSGWKWRRLRVVSCRVSTSSGGVNGAAGLAGVDVRSGPLPVRLLHDRVLVSPREDSADRRSRAGIVIPATAVMGKRLSWSDVVAVGTAVRTVQVGDRVLFDPEDRAEVELHGSTYILLRERDVHAVAAERLDDGLTGLYL
jgi:chaperonin GroES